MIFETEEGRRKKEQVDRPHKKRGNKRRKKKTRFFDALLLHFAFGTHCQETTIFLLEYDVVLLIFTFKTVPVSAQYLLMSVLVQLTRTPSVVTSQLPHKKTVGRLDYTFLKNIKMDTRNKLLPRPRRDLIFYSNEKKK